MLQYSPESFSATEVEFARGQASIAVAHPAEGRVVYFLECEFEMDGLKFNLSTQLRIVGKPAKKESGGLALAPRPESPRIWLKGEGRAFAGSVRLTYVAYSYTCSCINYCACFQFRANTIVVEIKSRISRVVFNRTRDRRSDRNANRYRQMKSCRRNNIV